MLRLQLFRKDGRIQIQDIDLLHGKKQEDIIFEIIDAILEAKPTAIEKLETYIQNHSIYEVLPSILGNIRKILYTLECQNAGWSKEQILSIGKIHPFVYQKNIIHKHKREQIKKLYI